MGSTRCLSMRVCGYAYDSLRQRLAIRGTDSSEPLSGCGLLVVPFFASDYKHNRNRLHVPTILSVSYSLSDIFIRHPTHTQQ